MMIMNPLYGLLLGVIVLFETWFSMILRGNDIPKPDPFYGFIRKILVIALASFIADIILYNPISKGEIISLILILLSAYIGLISILVLKHYLESIPILVGFIASLVFSFFLGIIGALIGLISWAIALLIQYLKKYELKKIEEIADSNWKIIRKFHLLELSAIVEALVLVARVQGFVLI